jgi:hypothetical protein
VGRTIEERALTGGLLWVVSHEALESAPGQAGTAYLLDWAEPGGDFVFFIQAGSEAGRFALVEAFINAWATSRPSPRLGSASAIVQSRFPRGRNKMANYMVLYTGGMGMAASPEEQEKIRAEWGAWYGKLGATVVDGGAPFGDSKHLKGNGVEDGSLHGNPATGYTVIEADSLDAAAAACADHPHLTHGGQVEIFTCIDMGPSQ